MNILQVTALFVRNLTMDVPQQKIRDIFQKATNIPILKLKKINHFAFVHYETRELAERAMQIMTSKFLNSYSPKCLSNAKKEYYSQANIIG